jgi:hypothetical protein
MNIEKYININYVSVEIDNNLICLIWYKDEQYKRQVNFLKSYLSSPNTYAISGVYRHILLGIALGYTKKDIYNFVLKNYIYQLEDLKLLEYQYGAMEGFLNSLKKLIK